MLSPGVWALWAAICPAVALRPHEEAFLLSDALVEDPPTPRDLDEQVQQVQPPIDFESLEEMPRDCSSGMLQLGNGTYKVTESTFMTMSKDHCNIVSDGARLLLEEPISFLGQVNFSGRLSVQCLKKFHDAGLDVRGDCTVASGAELRVENCTNVGSGGGGVTVSGGLHVDGTLEVHQSHSRLNGGGVYVDRDLHLRGKMNITGCTADRGGGAVYLASGIMQSGGLLTIRDSEAQGSGGAIYGKKNLTLSNGSLTITNSKGESGGAVYLASGSLMQSGGLLTIRDSEAQGNGGAVFIEKNLMLSDGHLTITNSKADESGGAVYLASGIMQSGGLLTIRDSEAQGNGGAVFIENNLMLSDGNLTITKSKADRSGGALHVENSSMLTGGVLTISSSQAGKDGGAICVRKNLSLSDSVQTISNSQAGDNGGAIWVEYAVQRAGTSLSISNSTARLGGGLFTVAGVAVMQSSLRINSSVATAFGGCLYASRGQVMAENGEIVFSHCHSNQEGGGIYARADVVLLDASIHFVNLNASRGAAATIQNLRQVGGQMVIDTCSASSTEVLIAANWTMNNGEFRALRSSSPTSLLAAERGIFNSTRVVANECQHTNGIFVLGAAAVMSNASFYKSAFPQIRAESVNVKNINISGTEAWISSPDATFERIDCDREYGGLFDSTGPQCRRCDAGYVFRKNSTDVTLPKKSAIQKCVKCPENVRSCNGTSVRMEPGVMVELEDISRALRCPNYLACPGGVLSDVVTETKPMCREGYCGTGCSTCSKDYARSDSNAFICLKCAKDTWKKIWDVLTFLAEDVIVLALCAAGAMNAKGRIKNSVVYMNQLMSFAAVAGPALMALQETNSFKHTKTLRSTLKTQFLALMTLGSVPVKVSDAGDGSTGVAAECLLGYMGLEPTMYGAHILSSCVYLTLGLLLALASGPRVALVVTVNCFLAKFCSAFGKYLICYRLETEGDRQCMLDAPYLVPGAVACVAIILLCFVVGPGVWYWMIRDKSRKNEPSVLYLTQSYQEGCEHWEVERLVRKMLLKLSNKAFPITLNPAYQMVSINLVLVASLVLHAKNRPYVKAEWNNMEAALPVAALCIVALTTLTLANENHWARSEEMQLVLTFSILMLIMTAGGVSFGQLVRELYREKLAGRGTGQAS